MRSTTRQQEIYYLDESRSELSFSQRWNSYLTIALAISAVLLGLTLRNSTLNASQTFEDLEAGIRAQIPSGWIVDSDNDTDYVFRAQDPNALPFKTLLQVSVIPVGPDAAPDNVLTYLDIQRPAQLSAYTRISVSSITLRDGSSAVRMVYAYTQNERNPFLESVPIVVQGVDVVVLRRSQAVIITYREERNSFDDHLYRMDNLLQTLEIF
jgi:hypothetical protein